MLLHKLGLVSNLRRVPESKIIGAEMREAQRKAEERLAELHAKDGTICEHAMARVDELLTKLKDNLNELESFGFRITRSLPFHCFGSGNAKPANWFVASATFVS